MANLGSRCKHGRIELVHGRQANHYTMAADAAPLTQDDLRDELQRALTHYATKADLGDVRDELRCAMANYATKADVADMRADLQATRAEFKADFHSLTRWMVVAVLGSVGAAAAVTGLIVRFFS